MATAQDKQKVSHYVILLCFIFVIVALALMVNSKANHKPANYQEETLIAQQPEPQQAQPQIVNMTTSDIVFSLLDLQKFNWIFTITVITFSLIILTTLYKQLKTL